ncbi:hypothetical protein B0H10DRAFT_2210951 [Mycena sp. CBHHK59/15]|nr:hypothetical protein B0H10DRAFT_2210951 [Mycena sp. CBHHK59/15]
MSTAGPNANCASSTTSASPPIAPAQRPTLASKDNPFFAFMPPAQHHARDHRVPQHGTRLAPSAPSRAALVCRRLALPRQFVMPPALPKSASCDAPLHTLPAGPPAHASSLTNDSTNRTYIHLTHPAHYIPAASPPPRPPPRPKGIGTSVSMTQTATRAKRHVGRYHAHA